VSVARKESILVVVFFVVTLLMTNPPVVYWVSRYAESVPLTLGWPTLWVWLQFWYLVMIGGLVLFGLKLKSWNVEYIEEALKKQREVSEHGSVDDRRHRN